jgi:hypothetical protein
MDLACLGVEFGDKIATIARVVVDMNGIIAVGGAQNTKATLEIGHPPTTTEKLMFKVILWLCAVLPPEVQLLLVKLTAGTLLFEWIKAVSVIGDFQSIPALGVDGGNTKWFHRCTPLQKKRKRSYDSGIVREVAGVIGLQGDVGGEGVCVSRRMTVLIWMDSVGQAVTTVANSGGKPLVSSTSVPDFVPHNFENGGFA